MQFAVRLAAVSLLSICSLCAQLHFEVASVKTVGGDELSTRPHLSRGHIAWTTQLNYFVAYAYGLDFSRVSGPKNVDIIYSFEATFAPTATDAEVRQMAQALLLERFRMRMHRVTTQAAGQALIVAKSKPKLKQAQDPAADATYIAATSQEPGVTQIAGVATSMGELARILQRITRTPIWDRTGLKGEYDFSFRFTQDLSADVKADAPALATALQESLGLKLVKQRGPVESIVIDGVEEPVAN